jgi:uncharacterized protein
MEQTIKSTTFIIWTLGISYLFAGVYYLSGGELAGVKGLIMGIVYMFIPAMVTLIISRLFYPEEIVNGFQISFRVNKWFFLAWIFAPVLSFLALGISLFFPEISYSYGMEGLVERFGKLLTSEQIHKFKGLTKTFPVNPFIMILLQGMLAGLIINGIAGLGQELGWRGFLLNQFRNMYFFRAAIIIGLVWGIWYAPIILMGFHYPQHPEFGILMMILFCVLLSPLFLYITIKSKSIIASSILNGTINGTAGISIILISGGNDLITGITGISVFIALILILSGLFIYDYFFSKDRIMMNEIWKKLDMV